MLDEAWCCMDTFATLSFDVILYIYIYMLCGIICNKMCTGATKFKKNKGKITMYLDKYRQFRMDKLILTESI